MASVGKFVPSLVILVLLCAAITAVSLEDDFLRCQSTVENWAVSSLDEEVKEDKHMLQDLLFFLHVPRTGGRTYFHCFLRKLYTSYLECPRSYDKLRFDLSKPNCRLMATHDDYSIMSKLPKAKNSVFTILRNPIDRVFSTYEFSVEVAARFLVHPNLTSVIRMNEKIRSKDDVSTLDIWPWKYLVPWMTEDLFARSCTNIKGNRSNGSKGSISQLKTLFEVGVIVNVSVAYVLYNRRDAREHEDVKEIKETNNPYKMEGIVMPLHEFINDPVAHEIIHNGATFQIAGLTNNSYLTESHEVRHCVRKYRGLGEYVLKVAKKRLDNMLYVGLTEEHKISATIFANVVGEQVLSQLQMLSSSFEQTVGNKTELSSPFPDYERDNAFVNKKRQETKKSVTKNGKTTNETMTVGELMEAYEACTSSLRKTQARRRAYSFKRISPANFSKVTRLQVPEAVLKNILSLNSLDMELYKHAQVIFAQQKSHLTQKQFKVEWQPNVFENSYEALVRKFVILAITVLLFLILIFLLVHARIRRTLKLKLRK